MEIIFALICDTLYRIPVDIPARTESNHARRARIRALIPFKRDEFTDQSICTKVRFENTNYNTVRFVYGKGHLAIFTMM